MIGALFGARGQLAVGCTAFAVVVGAWVYGELLRGEALIHFLFEVSMAALLVAAYSIVATALGYKATERVEQKVIANVEHADEVDVS